MDPTNDNLYEFLKTLLSEVGKLFPDEYIHLGVDEVPMGCWKSNPNVRKFMEEHGMEGRYNLLEEHYITRLLNLSENLNLKNIVWQDVFDNRVALSEDTIVQVWTGDWRSELSKVTAKGHNALISACWYLDHIGPNDGDWLKFYQCDPLDFPGLEDQRKKLLGGEACMWSEFVDK